MKASTILPGLKGNVHTKRTPNGWHLYRATIPGIGTYGWGATPEEAREKLRENIRAAEAEKSTELTPAGEQFVIPGCERNASPKARQLGLFG